MPGRKYTKKPSKVVMDELTAVQQSMPKSKAATEKTKKSFSDQKKFLLARSAEQRARAKKEAKARADRAANRKTVIKKAIKKDRFIGKLKKSSR